MRYTSRKGCTLEWLVGVWVLLDTLRCAMALIPSTTATTRTTQGKWKKVTFQATRTKLHLNDVHKLDSSNEPRKSLVQLLSPSQSCKVDQMSGTDLAYIGDVVFELFIRSRHVWPSKRTADLQNLVVSTVRAEHQSQILERLKIDFVLTDKELQVLMRGRNSVTRSKNRRDPAAYQDSTSFEALIGYLYISDKDRCTDLLNWLDANVDVVGS